MAITHLTYPTATGAFDSWWAEQVIETRTPGSPLAPTAAEAYESHTVWCHRHRRHPVAFHRFIRQLEARGLTLSVDSRGEQSPLAVYVDGIQIRQLRRVTFQK